MNSILPGPTNRCRSRLGISRAMDKHHHQDTTLPPQKTHSPIPHLKARVRIAAIRLRPKLQKSRQPRTTYQSRPTSYSIAAPQLVRRWSRRCHSAHLKTRPYDLRQANPPLVNRSSAPNRTPKQHAASPRTKLNCSTGLCPPTARETDDRPMRQPLQKKPSVLLPQRRGKSWEYTHKVLTTYRPNTRFLILTTTTSPSPPPTPPVRWLPKYCHSFRLVVTDPSRESHLVLRSL